MSDKLALTDYLTLKGTLYCVTGLRIGTSEDVIEIGGMDKPIIKHPLSGLPYVPGSSLKGKMRALLELRHDKIDARREVEGRRNRNYGEVHRPGGYGCEGEGCPICRLFGSNAGEGQLGPARLIVRDAYLTKASEEQITESIKAGKPITEVKHENTINRITAMANPRTMERVPAGMTFTFEIGYRVFDTGDGGTTDRSLFKYVTEGLQLVMADTLGGSGSRGYGKVTFDKLTLSSLNQPEPLLDKVTVEELMSFELPS
jgi:CRISPR-associated protein Csm3